LKAEVTGVTFSDYDSVSVPSLNPDAGPVIFKFENPISAQKDPASVDPTESHQCFYSRNDHEESCCSQKRKVTSVRFSHIFFTAAPVSSEISDLCEISDLLSFFSYFASQNKEIKSGNNFFDVCCVN